MKNKNSKQFFHGSIDKLHSVVRILMPKFSRHHLKEMFELDLSMHHLMVLKTISHSSEPPKISEIGKHLSIPFALMTRILDQLQSKNLVRRVHDPKDRRIYRIELTNKGKELSRKAQEMHKKHMTQVFDKLKENDRKKFFEALTTIIDILYKYKEGAEE